MKFSRRSLFSALSGSLAFFALQRAEAAGTVVKVSLWDKGAASMDGMGTTLRGMAMADAGPGTVTMGITVEKPEIPKGAITFVVTNDSAEFYHSLAIAPVANELQELPYLVDRMMVDETAAGTIARSKELRPHASGSVMVDLQPGTYILFCNVAGHYAMGMWALVTVLSD